MGPVVWATAAFAFIVIRQVQAGAMISLWLTMQMAFGILTQLSARCSLGLFAAAAGLISRIRGRRDRRAIALRAFAKLLQTSGKLLRRCASAGAAASSHAAAKARAARAAAVDMEAMAASKWTELKKCGFSVEAPRPQERGKSEEYNAQETALLCDDGSLRLTPEEALATACDLWASLHNVSPSRRIGVLELQELLRQHLAAKDGSLYLLPEGGIEKEREGDRMPRAHVEGFEPQQRQKGGHYGTAFLQRTWGKFLDYAAHFCGCAARVARSACAFVAAVLCLPFQQQQQRQQGQQASKQASHGRDQVSLVSLPGPPAVSFEGLLQDLGAACRSAFRIVSRIIAAPWGNVTRAVQQTARGSTRACADALMSRARAMRKPVDATLTAGFEALFRRLWR